MRRRLPRSFFARDVLDVAPDLLGCSVSHGGVTVRLTEVEAYAGYLQDPGSHAYRGQTPRTAPMFGQAGVAYVYFTYGMHWCLNLVTGPPGSAQAVLLRAGEVVGGLDIAASRRPRLVRRDLARGPARLAGALGMSGADSGVDFCSPHQISSCAGPSRCPRPRRCGPDRAWGLPARAVTPTHTPWRYWVHGEPTVSAYRPAKPRARRAAT